MKTDIGRKVGSGICNLKKTILLSEYWINNKLYMQNHIRKPQKRLLNYFTIQVEAKKYIFLITDNIETITADDNIKKISKI